MSSSQYQSPLRKSPATLADGESLSLPTRADLKLPQVVENNLGDRSSLENKVKNPLEYLADSTKSFLWNLPKALEATCYLGATLVVSVVISPIQSLFNGKSISRNREDLLADVISWGREKCNKYLYCGSLLGEDKEFIFLKDGEIKDRLNPLGYLGESLMSSLVYTIDYARLNTTRAIYNYSNETNFNLEEFRQLEQENDLLRGLKSAFDLAKAGASLIVLKKLSPSTMKSWQPLGIAGSMSLANAVGTKWQDGKTAVSVDTAEKTLEGISNSLFFMGFMRGASSAYVNSSTSFFTKELRVKRSQWALEKYDLRDSLPDLISTLHKARHDILDKDTDRPRDLWATLGHGLSIGSAMTDVVELKLLDRLSTNASLSMDHLNERNSAKDKRKKPAMATVPSETVELEEALEKLVTYGESVGGKINSEVITLAYDVLIKTAEHWKRKGVNFVVAISKDNDLRSSVVVNLDPLETLSALQKAFGANGKMQDVGHLPYLIVLPKVGDNSLSTDSLNFIARKLAKKSSMFRQTPWFLFFSPLQIAPFESSDAYFAFNHGIALGATEALSAKKDDTLPHEYIHAYVEIIQSNHIDYPRISPIYDARILDFNNKDVSGNKKLIEESITYFSDACRLIEGALSGDKKKKKLAMSCLINACYYSEGMLEVIDQYLEKIKTKKTGGITVHVFNNNAVGFDLTLEDLRIAQFTVSPAAIVSDLSLLVPSFRQRAIFQMKMLLRRIIGVKVNTNYATNFNNSYRDKALDILAVKLQYTRDFVSALDVAFPALSNLLAISDDVSKVPRLKRAEVVDAINKSVITIREALAKYLLWEVPSEYTLDPLLESIKRDLPIYRYVLSDLKMKEGIEVFSDPTKTIEQKIDAAYFLTQGILCHSRESVYKKFMQVFEDFLVALSPEQRQELSLKRRFREIMKALGIKIVSR